MRAVDTNVVVRLLIADNPLQTTAAEKLVAEHEVLVPVTVILETEWVMRSGYAFNPMEIAAGLRELEGMVG